MRGMVALLALLAAGCGGGAVHAPRAAPAVVIRQVDGFPLYEMTDHVATPPVVAPAGARPWGCTVFLGAGGRPIVGRNFDWHDQPALLLHHEPPHGFASVSMVDIEYLGFDRRHLARLDDPGARRALLRASALPFDGMNERGLAVAMAAVPAARAPRRAASAGELGVMRLVLDHAANVAQAVRIFRLTTVRFDGPPLHYLVADASGASAVVEYVHGRVRVLPRGRRPYQAMTNFVLSTSRVHDRRYRTAMTALRAARGRLTPVSTLALLRRVRQPITRWSVAYDLRARTLKVVMGQRYERVLSFRVKP